MKRRTLHVSAAVGTALACAATARAQGDAPLPPAPKEPIYAVGSVGLLYSYVLGSEGGHAIGGEASYTYFPDKGPPAQGYGGFFQVQAYPLDTARYAAGAQMVYSILGAEVGWAYRTTDGVREATHGIHLAPFLSIGFLHIATRGTIALGGSRHWSSEFAFTVGLKAPFPLPNFPEYINMNMPSGRPPRDVPFEAGEEAGWARVAREEQASITTFARLTEELALLGAPAPLVARALSAALEERAHAERALAIASDLTGRGLSLAPLPIAPPRLQGLPALVLESYVDGCLGEGLAAEVARRAKSRPACRAVTSFYAMVAREEHSHAELAWSIVEWGLSAGGEPVREAMSRVLEARVVTDVPAADREAARVVRTRARRRLRRWLGRAALGPRKNVRHRCARTS